MKKRLLVAAILGGLQAVAPAAATDVPPYWVAAPIFKPYDPNLRGGIFGGAVTSAGYIPGGAFILDPPPLAGGIDTNLPFYPVSGLGTAFTPDFRGGTLRIDVSGTYAYNFTIDSQGGTIDQYGNAATFSGVFADATPGVPGALTIANSAVGGSVTLTGVNTYTGQTTINGGANLALAGSGSIAYSRSMLDNGVFDISATATGTSIKTLSGGGMVDLGGKFLTLTDAAGNFSGVLGGTGGLAIAGGNEVLTGANTYTGGTTINPGAALQLGNGGTDGSIAGDVTDNGSLIFRRSDEAVFGGAIAGSGSLTQAGTGVLKLTGANTYTGGTTISPGTTLQLGNGGVGGGIVGNVIDNGGLVFRRSNALTFDGSISGSGYLIQAGTGTLTLTGANTYSGGTAINAGATLALAGAGRAGSGGLLDDGLLDISATTVGTSIQTLSGSGAVNLGAKTLRLGGAGDIFAGAISGSGGLTVAGGVEKLAGSGNRYTGLTTIQPSAGLALIGAGSIASSSGVLDDGLFDIAGTAAGASIKTLSGSGTVALGSQTLTLTGAADSFAGTFTGAGGLTVAGGTERLTGYSVHSYAGLTTINSGATLALNGSGIIDNATGVAANGTLDLSDLTQYSGYIASLSGNGNVRLGSNTLFLGNAAGTFAGVIDGATEPGKLGLVVLGGKETLTGANTYNGLTGIDKSATLALAGAGSIAHSSGVGLVGGGTFDLSAAQAGGSVNNLFSVASSIVKTPSTVSLGANTLTLTHAGVEPVYDPFFAGTIVGTGGLTVAGGTETLTGVNTYTGLTTVNSGATLALAGTGSIASSSGLVDNGVFDISATTAGASVKTLSGNGTVNLGAQTLTLTQATGTFAGVIDGTAGGLVIAGGALTLTGSYRFRSYPPYYVADTTINPGATLIIGDGSTSGGAVPEITNNGSLVFNSSGTYQALAVTGSGSVTVAGGTLTLVFASNYTGGTIINPGATLKVGEGGGFTTTIRGDVIDNGSLVFNQIAPPPAIPALLNYIYPPFVFDGTITGTGSLTLVDARIQSLVLTASNTYTGGTTINPRATLQLGNGGTTGSIVGDVIDNGNLAFNRSDDIVFGGAITGSGRLTQLGTGSLTLTGTDTLGSFVWVTAPCRIPPSYRCSSASGGGTFVERGTLKVNGILNSPVEVSAGATLRGTGFINGPLNVSGSLAPGNSPGTLTVNGPVALAAGSTYQEDIDGLGTGNGAGNYSRLLVNGAGNRFTANGTLTPTLRGITGNASNTFTPSLGDSFRIVTATGGIIGRFANVIQPTGLAGGTQLDVFYNAYGNNSIDLIATPRSYANWLAVAGANDNGLGVGRALDRMRAKDAAGLANTRQSELRYSVAGLRAAQIAPLATTLTGEVHGAIAAAAPEAGRWLQTSVARQLASPLGGLEQAGIEAGDNLWVDFNASQGRSDSDAFASGYSSSRYQFAVGVDLVHSGASRFGLGATYASTSVSPKSGSGTLEETAPFLYGQYVFGKEQKVILDGLFSYGFSTWKTERADPLRRAGSLKTNADGNSALWSVGVRSPWAFGGFTVEPFARVLWQNSNRNAVNEGLASPSALSLPDYSMNGTRVLVGAAVGSAQGDPLATALTYRASLAFGNDFGDLVHPTVQSSLAGEPAGINSPHVGRQFAQLNLAATYRLIDNAYGYVALNGEARSNRIDGGVNAGFSFKF